MFARSTLSFAAYTAVFVVAATAASVFIVPMLAVSLAASAVVVVFNGISHAAFKVASAKYNHTVLFLNRVLRQLADNIPPSVGVVEVAKNHEGTVVPLKTTVTRLLSKLNVSSGAGTGNTPIAIELPQHGANDNHFHVLDGNAPLVYDEDLSPVDMISCTMEPASDPEPDTVKDGAAIVN